MPPPLAMLAVLALLAAGCTAPARRPDPSPAPLASPTSTSSRTASASSGLREPTAGPGGGGATSKGVTDRSITVAFHWNSGGCGGDITERLTNFGAKPRQVVEAFVDWVNRHAEDGTVMNGVPVELHGRRIRPVFVATGGAAPECAAVSRAGAIRIAEEERAFAAVSSTLSYDEAVVAPLLAGRGTMHFGSVGLPESFYSRLHPYVWSPYATATVQVRHLADYVTGRLGRGGPPGQNRYDGRRVFGLVHADQPGPRAVAAELKAALGRTVSIAAEVRYTPDIAQAQAQATAGVNRLRSAGVNTVIMLTDPVAPIVLTSTAQSQQWSPDYLVSSYGYLDTGAAAANYDPAQWRHAFGVSDLGSPAQGSVTELRELPYAAAYREVRPGEEPPDDAIAWWSSLSMLVAGISAAGPGLTPQSVAAGLTDRVAATTDAGARLDVVPGRHGTIDDFGLVSYSPDATDPRDPIGRSGRRRGRYVFYEGTRRYRTGQPLEAAADS